MFRQLFLKLFLSLSLLLVTVMPAQAGGWAAVTLDQLPQDVEPGEPVTIGFVVRQHGITPLSGLSPKVFAKSGAHRVEVWATEDRLSHYTATLIFPEAGTWEWVIDGFGVSRMPPLQVTLQLQNPVADTGAEQVSRIPPLQARLQPASIEQLVARILAWLRPLPVTETDRNSREGQRLALLTQDISRPAATIDTSPADSHVEYGQALFIAKGCKTCHEHRAIAGFQSINSFSTGPDLTTYQPDPTFLRDWLRNPVAVRPRTQMPTLGLNDTEIEALIAFLEANVN